MKHTHRQLVSFLAALAVSAMSTPGSALIALANTFETAEEIKVVDTFALDFDDENSHIWYHFTAPQDGTYTFQSLGNLDTCGYLYKSTDMENYANSDDDSG